jgi:uncharacterized membrane protein YoaK (UPF0700 family)
MSGNSTQLAVGVGQGSWLAAAQGATVVGVFVLGSFAGTLIGFAVSKHRLQIVLVLEAGLLGCGALMHAPIGEFSVIALPLAFAMGLQNTAMSRVGERAVGLTYVTGTLVRLGSELAESIARRAKPWAWNRDAGLWLAMVTGAVAGAVLFGHLGLRALLVPVVVALSLAVTANFYD